MRLAAVVVAVGVEVMLVVGLLAGAKMVVEAMHVEVVVGLTSAEATDGEGTGERSDSRSLDPCPA
jgi:hypothetical protein